MPVSSHLRQRLVQRGHLVSAWHLWLLAFGLIAVLFILAPNSSLLIEDSAARSDYLSLPYLQAFLAIRPHDQDLQLRLSHVLLDLNRPIDADRIFAQTRSVPMPSNDPRQQLSRERLAVQIDVALLAQEPARAAREPQLKQRTVQEIEALLAEPLSTEDLVELATTSLGIGRPDLAARIFLRLSDVDPKRCDTWLTAAAQQLNASDQPAMAANLYDTLAQRTSDPQLARRYALLALGALASAGPGQIDKALALASVYLARFADDAEILQVAARVALANGQVAAAARYYEVLFQTAAKDDEKRRYAGLAVSTLILSDEGDAALAAAQRYLAQFPGDATLLRTAFKLAAARNRPRLRQEWGRALLAQEPRNGTLLAQQIDAELAAGDAAAALALARRLVALHPNDAPLRARFAQIAEWTGHPSVALTQWASLAMRVGHKSHFNRALKLASELYDMELLARLLATKARRGRLSNDELTSLAATYDSIGKPDELVHVLDDYLRRYPAHREAWEALAEAHEWRDDLSAALTTLERISRDFGSDLKETMHRAEILWQLQRMSEAYALLRDALDHAGVARPHELLARAERTRQEKGTQPQAVAMDPDRQPFLTLLAQLFFYHAPEPEDIAEYRKLWRAGALLSMNASRYIQLAHERGLTEEALSVAEEAFVRFNNPEYLVWALELVCDAGRWQDFARLMDTAAARPQVLAGNKGFYMIIARYHAQRGEYAEAQHAYLKAISLDPTTVAARVNLLWLLMDQSQGRSESAKQARQSRRELQRLLVEWRPMAENEPVLWLPFATASALAGKTADAVLFYRREWIRRPNAHLWLLGYASSLDASSRSSDAREIRRFAIVELRKEALHAAHKGTTQGERELLNAYVQLVRDTYGAGKGSRWLSGVLHSDLDPLVQRGLYAAWRSADNGTAMSDWVRGDESAGRKNPWGRYPKRPKPGQTPAPLTSADELAALDAAPEPEPEPLRVLVGDASTGEDQVPENAQVVTLESAVQSINELFILSSSLSGLIARGPLALGGHAGINQLFLIEADDPQAGAREVDLAVYGMWRHRLGRLEAGVGANLRADANLFSGWVSETFGLGRGGSLQLQARINEMTYDSRWLRIYGARHRVAASWSFHFLHDLFLDVQANFYQYHTRTNENIGIGANTGFSLSYRVHRVRPLWTLRTFAVWMRNFHLAENIPEFGGDSSYAQPPLLSLPTELFAAGIGSLVAHRFPGVAPIGAGRWRYMADVWLGWMWPINVLAFEARAGVALALPRRQEIRMTGFVANNRWLGPGVVNAGLTLDFLFR